MGAVAIGTTPLGDGFVDHRTLDHAIVTFLTEFVSRRTQEGFIRCAVGIVAGRATILLDDGVHPSLLRRIVVAVGTQGRGFAVKEPGVHGGVGIVTVRAAAARRRFVLDRSGHDVVVTACAKVLSGFGQQPSVGRTVRIVTAEAALILDDRMDLRTLGRLIVALKTEGRADFH